MDNLNQLLSNAQKVLVTSHLMPDLDAISSALAMYNLILAAYPNLKVDICLSGEKLEGFDQLKGYSQIIWVNDLTDIVNNYDTLVFTDASELKRFTKNPELLDLHKFKSICIDHHKGEVSNFNISIVETNQPSAAQIVYNHFFKDSEYLNAEVAEILLVGILSDTGFLKLVGNDALETFDYVKDLMQICDLTLRDLEQKYFVATDSDWAIIQELTKNIVKVNGVKYPFIFSYLPIEYFTKFSENAIRQGVGKFLLFFGVTLEGYKWGCVLYSGNSEKMYLSFRSSTNWVNVRLVAQNFNGGGHDQASGGSIEIQKDESTEDISKRVLEKIKSLDLELIK